jgi:nickel/cobalt transporter (NicO) family protein
MIQRFSLFIFIAFFLLFSPTFLYAHPLDEVGDVSVYDQKQFLTVTPNAVLLTINLGFYSIEKIKVWETIDTNRDEKLSDEEKSNWMKKGQQSSWIEKEGTKYTFEAQNLSFPDYYEFFDDGQAQVSISFVSNIQMKTGDNVSYFYDGKDKKLDEIEIVVEGKDGIGASETQKVDSKEVSFSIVERTEETQNVLGIAAGDKLNSFLNKYVKVDSLPPNILFIALVTSFVLGALHALTPGHGKALVAGYLVGEKGTVKNAFQLGGIVTFTHTASVFVLGILALTLTQYIVPATVISWMNMVSGILISVFGLYLFIKRILQLRMHDHDEHTHSHEHHEHEHDHPHHDLKLKSLLPLGISGGIVPCIDALAILIVAITLHKIILGLVLLIVFSLGLAATLVACGVAVVFVKGKISERVTLFHSLSHYSSILSALFVTALGLLLLFNR